MAFVIALLVALLLVAAPLQNAAPLLYDVVARLGEGRLGNAAFSSDSTRLAVATSTGLRLYNLAGGTAARQFPASNTPTLATTPALFVTYSAPQNAWVYLEPVAFRIGAGGFVQGATALNVWQAAVNAPETADIIASINLGTLMRRTVYLPETDQIVIELVSRAQGAYALVEVAAGTITLTDRVEVTLPPDEAWWPAHRVAERTLTSPDGLWQWRYHYTADTRFGYEGHKTIWYDLLWLPDETVVASSLNHLDSLGISLNPEALSWVSDTTLAITESLRCGTGAAWDVSRNTLSELPGYGGCGDNRSCQHVFGPYCAVYTSYNPETGKSDQSDFTVIYDWDYLDNHPDTADADFAYIVEGHTDDVLVLAVGSARRVILSGSADTTAIVWDVTAADEPFALAIRLRLQHPNAVSYVGFFPGAANRIVTASGGSIYFWDADTGALLNRLTGHSEPVALLAWSPDNHRFATASPDGVILVWEAAK
jgi:hypothetical protein